MASTPAIASGVSITSAGASGMLTGGTGLDGLFGALMGGEMAAPTGALGADAAAGTEAPVGEGMISVLLGVRAGDKTAVDPTLALKLGSLGNLFAQTTTQTEVQLGDAQPLTVTGDATAVAEFVSKVQDIYQKIITEGKLTIGQLSDSKELAGALTDMGMAPEEAAGVAERIQTMLKLLEQQQDVDDATAGSLVAMMLAVMGQQAPVANADGSKADTTAAPQLGLQIISVEQQAATPAASTMTSWQMRASGDVTRDLLGLNAPKDKADDASVEGEKVRKVEVAVTQDADASVAVAVGDIKTVHAPVREVAVDAVPSASAQAAAAITTTGAAVKVAADEVVQAPKGDTYYKLQADKNGVETLEAVKPASEVRDGMIGTAQTPSQPAHVALAQAQAAATSEAASFAERVAQINEMVDKAQVGKQVAVQMAPLLEQGGGTVRMSLNPEKLGHVTVELQVVDGKVHGSIAASEPAVVEQLARELHNLRHGLADAGLKLGEQGINLMLSNQGQQGQDQQSGQNGQSGQSARGGQSSGFGGEVAGEAQGTDLAANLAAWVAPERVLDVNV